MVTYKEGLRTLVNVRLELLRRANRTEQDSERQTIERSAKEVRELIYQMTGMEALNQYRERFK